MPLQTKEVKEVENHDESQVRTHYPAKTRLIVIAVVSAVLLLVIGAGAGALVGGIFNHHNHFERGNIPVAEGQFGGRMLEDHGRGMMAGAIGKVTAVSSSSITLSDDRTGSSATYKVTDNTDVNDSNGDNAKISDVKVGDTVRVRATSSTDDTAADTIVINPTSDQFLR